MSHCGPHTIKFINVSLSVGFSCEDKTKEFIIISYEKYIQGIMEVTKSVSKYELKLGTGA